ncbi:cytochrome c biogenesis factor, partial [filamentous cyanobacterium CCT1]
ALELDSRYGDLEFLEENLWGTDLLAATESFFAAPTVRALLAQL